MQAKWKDYYYLSDGAEVGAILEQKFNHFDTVLLACNVQCGEAILAAYNNHGMFHHINSQRYQNQPPPKTQVAALVVSRLHGSYYFAEINFHDFSMTFPDQINAFP